MGGFVEAAIEGGKRNKQGGGGFPGGAHRTRDFLLDPRRENKIRGLKSTLPPNGSSFLPFSKVVFAEKDQSYFESLTRERERERDTSTQGLQFSCSVD